MGVFRRDCSCISLNLSALSEENGGWSEESWNFCRWWMQDGDGIWQLWVFISNFHFTFAINYCFTVLFWNLLVIVYIYILSAQFMIWRLKPPLDRYWFHLNFSCSHYRRRCKIIAPCCNEIFDCRHCHNDVKVLQLVIILIFDSRSKLIRFFIY